MQFISSSISQNISDIDNDYNLNDQNKIEKDDAYQLLQNFSDSSLKSDPYFVYVSAM